MYQGQKFDLGNGISMIFALRVEIGNEHRYFQEWTPRKGMKFTLKNSVLVRRFGNNHEIRITVADGLGRLNPVFSKNGIQNFYSPDKLRVTVENSEKKITFISSWTKEEDGTRKLHVKKSEEEIQQKDQENQEVADVSESKLRPSRNKRNTQERIFDPVEARMRRKENQEYRERKNNPKKNARPPETIRVGIPLGKYPFL